MKNISNASNASKHLKVCHCDEPDVMDAVLEKKEEEGSKKRKASEVEVESEAGKLFCFSKSDFREKQLDWIVFNNLPFHIVESPQFQNMMSSVVPKYQTMSRCTFIELLGKKFDKMIINIRTIVAEIKEEFFGMKCLSLCHDMWTKMRQIMHLGLPSSLSLETSSKCTYQ